MIEYYPDRLEVDAEQYGAARIYSTAEPTWRLMVRGQKVAELTSEELDRLAERLAFRLCHRGVMAGPTGVELDLGEGRQGVHLCYSDEAEQVCRSIMAASGLDDVASGRVRR